MKLKEPIITTTNFKQWGCYEETTNCRYGIGSKVWIIRGDHIIGWHAAEQMVEEVLNFMPETVYILYPSKEAYLEDGVFKNLEEALARIKEIRNAETEE